jgi:hypothetical protein
MAERHAPVDPASPRVEPRQCFRSRHGHRYGRAKVLLFADANNAVWEWDGSKDDLDQPHTRFRLGRAPSANYVTLPGWHSVGPILTFRRGPAEDVLLWRARVPGMAPRATASSGCGIPSPPAGHFKTAATWLISASRQAWGYLPTFPCLCLRQPAPPAGHGHQRDGFDWHHCQPQDLGAGYQERNLVPAHPAHWPSHGHCADHGFRQPAWGDGAFRWRPARRFGEPELVAERFGERGREPNLGVQSSESRQRRGLHRRHGVDLRVRLLRGGSVLRSRGLFGRLPIVQCGRPRRHLHAGGCGYGSSR